MRRIPATRCLPRLRCSTNWSQRANWAKRLEKDFTSTSNVGRVGIFTKKCQKPLISEFAEQEMENVPADLTLKVHLTFVCSRLNQIKHLMSVFIFAESRPIE